MDTQHSELEDFREQWIEEVQKRKNTSAQSSGQVRTQSGSRSSQQPKDATSSATPGNATADVSAVLEALLHDSASSTVITDKSSHKALEHYLLAIAYEREGRLGEALAEYRKAFKQNSSVDSMYRQITQGKLGKAAQTNLAQAESTLADNRRNASDGILFRHQIGGNDEADDDAVTDSLNKPDVSSSGDGNGLDELVSSFGQLDLAYEAANERRPMLLARLPDDLVVHILKMAGVLDERAIGRFASGCKKFAFIARDPRLWRFMSMVTQKRALTPRFREMHTSVSVFDADSNDTSGEADVNDTAKSAADQFEIDETGSVQRLVQEARTYGGWLSLYLRRPRVRFDGMYVSTCHYLRPSSAENAWNTPVMLVTYYRYLRFFRDGTCMKLLSTSEPSSVSKQIASWSTSEKGIQRGIWRIDDEMRSVYAYVKDCVSRPNLTFSLDLRIKNTRSFRSGKLQWVKYSHIDCARGGSICDYNLGQFKPFYFLRVRSYPPM